MSYLSWSKIISIERAMEVCLKNFHFKKMWGAPIQVSRTQTCTQILCNLNFVNLRITGILFAGRVVRYQSFIAWWECINGFMYSLYYLLKVVSSTLVALFSHWIQMFCTFNKNLDSLLQYYLNTWVAEGVSLLTMKTICKTQSQNPEEGEGCVCEE